MTNKQKSLLLDYALTLAVVTLHKQPDALATYDSALGGVSVEEAQKLLSNWIADAKAAR